MKAGRILLAGAAGTLVMTMLMLMAPMMGLLAGTPRPVPLAA